MNRKFLGLLALGMLAVGVSMVAGTEAEGGLCDWLFGRSHCACAPVCQPYCGSMCDFDDDDWENMRRACHPVCLRCAIPCVTRFTTPLVIRCANPCVNRCIVRCVLRCAIPS